MLSKDRWFTRFLNLVFHFIFNVENNISEYFIFSFLSLQLLGLLMDFACTAIFKKINIEYYKTYT